MAIAFPQCLDLQLHQCNKVTAEWEMMKDLIVLFCFSFSSCDPGQQLNTFISDKPAGFLRKIRRLASF